MTNTDTDAVTSGATLGCAVDLVARVVAEVTGGDISASVSGRNLTLEAIGKLAVNRIQIKLNVNQANQG